MTPDDILLWYPPNQLHRTINAADTFSNLRLVTSAQLVADCVNFEDLPEVNRNWVLEDTHTTGFNLPDVEQAFILVQGSVVIPNRAHAARYPLLVREEGDILDLLGADLHWVWFGTGRRTAWADIRASRVSFAPQTNYRGAAGLWRRMATSSLLLGRGWRTQCPQFGSHCLRPDHWFQPGAHGLTPGLGQGRVANYDRILQDPIIETQPETQPETQRSNTHEHNPFCL